MPLKYFFPICAPGLSVFFFLCLATAEETSPQNSPAATHTVEGERAPNQAHPIPSPKEKTKNQARESFEHFTRRWMQKLVATEDFQKKEMLKIRQTTEGFIAEYIGYLPHRYTEIKLTQSEATPFIGILTYYKKTMRSRGKTEKQAINGLFEHAETSQVSEIFRYTKGKWVY